MQPTQISVLTDNTEYSRYESLNNTITATISVTGGEPYVAEAVLVELVKARRSRDAVVASSFVYFTGTTSPLSQTAQFQLENIVDQDNINLVRHGKYFVRARSLATGAVGIVGTPSSTPISLLTLGTGTDENLWSFEVLLPSGTSPLSVVIVGTHVTISLAVSAGVPVSSLNTREAIVAQIQANYGNTLAASFTGLANQSLNTAEGVTFFSGGRDEVVGASADVAVRIVTVQRLKNDFLFGIPRYAGDTRFVKYQPATVTGVLVVEVSRNHPLGIGPLTYTYLDAASNPAGVEIRQLSWCGGPLVTINRPGTFIIRKGSQGIGGGCAPKLLTSTLGQDYIVVRVTSLSALPTTNVTEELLVQNSELSDSALAEYLCQAESWLENVALGIYLEPTNVVTDRDATTLQFSSGINSPNPIFTDPDYDFISGPLTYFVSNATGNWVSVQMPFQQLIRVDSLFGAIANTRVIDIDLDWIQHYTQGGLVQLVPFNQSVAFDYLGLMWMNSGSGASAIPNFWHFNVIAGLRDCPCDLQELIAKKAAMDALIMLGNAIRPGVGSVSMGRDGVSQSVSYTTQQKYGAYTGTITAFKEWIDDNLRQYKGKYRGATLTVV